MSNELLEEAVKHLRIFLPLHRPDQIIMPSMANSWDRASIFLESIDMKMDEENAKHQQALMQVSDQQVIAMQDEYKKRFDNIVHPASRAEFRKLVNMLLCVSLVLEREL